MKLFDTTLRDGGNVVGDGFNAELTVSIVRGLLSAGIKDIELGSCKGLGAYERMGATRALSDTEYYSMGGQGPPGHVRPGRHGPRG